MGEKIIWCMVLFGCAALFFGIGVYARKRNQPMGFWSGSKVDAAQITDVKQYNQENGVMWQVYSLWFFAAGLARIWCPPAAVILLVLGCSAGTLLLVGAYKRIYKKYRVQ